MKKYALFCAVLFALCRTLAQSNAPVKLALISETDEAMPAADFLTAKLSSDDRIQLLERDQIEKVYQEQSLAAANRDYLKLGRILGADGLLLLNITRTPQATKLTTRLIAVKPGVILADGNFDWPLRGTDQWTEAAATYLDSFLPKLAVLPKDAIPISVVNLRSAISSADAAKMEQQLKWLVIQRLSQEPQLFVLERQKMQLLGDEKELKADDSTFWDGSYLLDGVIDQNGYSPDRVTINAQLSPPKSGAPILMETSGNRTNLSEVVNQLTAKIIEALKINSSVKAWNASDEAAKYFDEANWAMRWGAFAEARAAIESAWALGKKDPATAKLRITACINEVPVVVPPGVSFYSNGKQGFYVQVNDLPDPKDIDNAIYALQCYDQFNHTSLPNTLPLSSKENSADNRIDPEWYQLGLDILTTASQVLLHFNQVPQKNTDEKLAELRALTRSVAEWISDLPSVHDTYFVGDRVVEENELDHFSHEPSLYSLELNYGRLWQETPEKELEFYRQLMSSPVFCYIHYSFWFSDGTQPIDALPPRLIAWNKEDQEKLPQLWGDFLRELATSPNVSWQLEVKAIRLAEATNDIQMDNAFTNFFTTFFDNIDTLFTNRVEQLGGDWQISELIDHMGGQSYIASKDSLMEIYRSQYLPKLETRRQEYLEQVARPAETDPEVEKQAEYLRRMPPFDFNEFTKTFEFFTYSPAQAKKLQPLLISYYSNLLEKTAWKASKKRDPGIFLTEAKLNWVNAVLKTSTAKSIPKAQTKKVQATKVTMPAYEVATTNTLEAATNIVNVSKFLSIPLDGLPGDRSQFDPGTRITAHHWFEGKLLLNLQYEAAVYLFDDNGRWKESRTPTFSAIAILDPATEQWDVIADSEMNLIQDNHYYDRSVLLHGDLFTSNNGQIEKYDFQNRQWQVLPISDGSNYELFAVNGHLYAANGTVILEVMDGGKSTRILASNRRQPPASVLDKENFGTPVLFEGPRHLLRCIVADKIFTWTTNDWHEDFPAPPYSFTPITSDGGVLFLTDGFNKDPRVSRLLMESNAVELCFGQKRWRTFNGAPRSKDELEAKWKLPSEFSLPALPAALNQSELFFLAEYSKMGNIIDGHQNGLAHQLPKDDHQAELLCFSDPDSSPQKIFLKFDAPEGCPPVTGEDPNPEMPSAWMLFTTNLLFFGLERPDNITPFFAQRQDIGYKVGVWVLPLSQINPIIAEQKQIQLVQQAQAESTKARAAKDLVTRYYLKYDLNHNGVIDPEEREAALDDPAFIESELDMIDTNHNGWLDLAELAYFDANHDKILEPKEEAGIEIAQHLLAKRDLEKFDMDGDGVLSQEEFSAFLQADHIRGITQPYFFHNADENHDGKIELTELESFLNQSLRRNLIPRGTSGVAFYNQIQAENDNPTTLRQRLFKLEVENYWRDPGSITNGPQFDHAHRGTFLPDEPLPTKP